MRVLRFGHRRTAWKVPELHDALARLGHIPLPPYIKRADEPLIASAIRRFTPSREARWRRQLRGCTSRPAFWNRCAGAESRRQVTLDVGLGTFEPVRTENLEQHKIHAESYEIPEATAEAAFARKGTPPRARHRNHGSPRPEDAADKASATGKLIAPGKLKPASFSFSRQIFPRCRMSCSRISTFRSPHFWRWSRPLPARPYLARTVTRSLPAIVFTVMATVC